LNVMLIGFKILGGHKDELAGESVTEGAEAGAVSNLGNSGSGGVAGIIAIDLGAVGYCV
jgi:hypothetical protein